MYSGPSTSGLLMILRCGVLATRGVECGVARGITGLACTLPALLPPCAARGDRGDPY